MNERKMNRAISLLLIPCLLITSLFISAFPTTAVTFEDSEARANTTADVTLEDVLAGAAEPSDLYGELDASTVPDAVGLETAKSRGHVRRMYSEEGESLYNVVFLNADGTRTLYLFGHPVKYVDTHGEIRDISLEIADSSLPAASFETAAGLTATRFASKFSDGITLSGSDTSITLVPVLPQALSAGTSMSATAMSSSPVKRINSKTVSYAYDDKTTIEYSLTYTGFKEDIVVSEYTGQTEYDFRLQTNGLALKEMDGSYYLVDEEDTVKATIGDIIIFTADNRNNALGSIAAKEIKANQEYLLTIVVDEEYLSDPDTAYPIRIDPTIELTYALSGAGVIEDVTLNSLAGSAGSSASLGVGKRGTYGISRILMKFPGLDLSGIASASAISSATVELRDMMCESTAMELYCHIFTGNTWTESTATWSNVGAGSYISTPMSQNTISYANGAAQASDHRYPFDITTAVKGWKSSSYVQDEGIIFKASSSVENGSTNLYKTFGSYNRGSYEPRLYVTYTAPPSSFSLNYTSFDIDEGSTKTLTATGASGTVTWRSNNTAVATVSSSGVVTAKKAGVARIIASVSNSAGTRTASCTVYVTIADGVYYIKNNASGYYLGAANEGIFNGTNVAQYAKTTSGSERLAQLWKIKYLSNGYYSVRPMHKLDMGLHVTSGNVDIWKIGTSDVLGVVMSSAWWTITYNTNGYVFKNGGSDSKAMTPSGGSTGAGTSVVASTYSSTSAAFRWTLERQTSVSNQVLLYDTVTGERAEGTIRYVAAGETRSLSMLKLEAAFSSAGTIDQSVTWESDAPGVATVDATTGAVTGVSPGDATIICSKRTSDIVIYRTSYIIKVASPFNLNVHFDQAYLSRFGTTESDAIAEIEPQLQRLRELYLEEFSIMVTYSRPSLLPTYASENCAVYFDSRCSCGNCSNSVDRDNLSDYHHTNFHNILLRIPLPNPPISATALFIGHEACAVVGNRHDNRPGYGLAYPEYGIVGLNTWGTTNENTRTLVHEIGHIFGAPDHYGINCPSTPQISEQLGDDNFNSYCIYGESRLNSLVNDNLIICEGCKNQIKKKAGQFFDPS